MSEVSRKIHFYQIIWVKNNGNKVQKSSNFIQQILNNISTITTNNIINKLSSNTLVGDELCLENYPLQNPQFNMLPYKLSRIRNGDLPLIYDAITKSTSPITLQDMQALFEPSHFVIFDGAILGAEYNHYGIRYVHSNLVRMIN